MSLQDLHGVYIKHRFCKYSRIKITQHLRLQIIPLLGINVFNQAVFIFILLYTNLLTSY